MSNFQPRNLQKRALLADVLPFEVPIIFTNDFFFASTLPLKVTPQTLQILAILRDHSGFTIPYNYGIVKDRGRVTHLSIIHPIVQLKWAHFVDSYAETIITYCSRSETSLRHPFALVTQHATAPLEREATARDGLPHELLEENVPDFSRMSSYFRLRRFNILAKFIDSGEMVALEKRFSHLLTLDISKCFYNLYTHSIAWAVKTKPFAKSQLGSYTFEDQFDEIMQLANYKETNGIVVGPEISRMFAEIIFQSVDRRLQADLVGVLDGAYEVRRYVDDFFVFANSERDAEKIESVLASILAEYKLYLNYDKRSISHRPFVSPISRLKREITTTIDEVAKSIKQASASPVNCDHRSIAGEVRQKLRELRLAVAPDEVGFHNISGWLMWKLRRMSSDAASYLGSTTDEDTRDCAAQAVSSVMQLAFYVTALDFRVRTGFNLALLITSLLPRLQQLKNEQSEWLINFLFEETIDLFKNNSSSRAVNSIELCNLLLTGAHSFSQRFVRTHAVEKAISDLASMEGDYRAYITAKFCMLKDSIHYVGPLAKLNDNTERWLHQNMSRLKYDTETYLIFCDMISSPDLTIERKRALLTLAVAPAAKQGKIGPISEEAATEVEKLIGFADWTGVRLRHTLGRRQLRSSREY